MKDAGLLRQFIAVSRYARWIESETRRESWEDTVSRYVNFMDEHTEGNYHLYLRDTVHQAICNHKVMPSMRALMTAGEAAARENIAIFNCAYIAINSKRKFAEALYILMCGTGVGFSCERQEIQNLPVVPASLVPCDDIITIGDSKEGWAKGFRKLVSCLYDGDIPTMDYSHIRPAGARLKVFGGRASGSRVFRNLCEYTVALFKKAKGRKLNSIEVHDLMCTIGEIVVVGGVRRSALISLSNLSDLRMREAKTGQWYVENPQRALANNSVAYTEKPNVEIFMEEWLALIRSKSGERGIFYRVAAQKQASRHGRRSADANYGTNPCLSGDTLVLVPGHGYRRIAALAGSMVEVINQDGNVADGLFAMTSAGARLYEVTLSNGAVLSATANHNFVDVNGNKVAVRDLVAGTELMVTNPIGMFGTEHKPYAAYLDAWLIADGTWSGKDANSGDSKLYLYGDKRQYAGNFATSFTEYADGSRSVGSFIGKALPDKRHVPDYVLSGDKETVLAFVRGYLESDGHLGETSKGWTMQFSSIHRSFLQDLQALLRLLGARGKIALMSEAGSKLLPDGCGGMALYPCKDCYRLSVSNPMAVMQHLFPDLVKRGVYAKEERVYVDSVAATQRIEPVYCAGVEDTNSFALPFVMSGNCGEIILLDRGFCNLSEVVVRSDDTLESLKYKVEIATVLGTLQSTMTNFGFLDEEWKRNAESERLLGVSLTGIYDNRTMAGLEGMDTLIEWLTVLHDHAWEVNAKWASLLGIAPSAAITTIKPSGTVSQLVDSSSGIHPRHSKFYLRTVRLDKKDPLCKFMQDQGIYSEPAVGREDVTQVFYFPVKSPDGAVLRDDVSAINHLNLVNTYYRYWCDHNVSVTITVRDEEWFSVGAWVFDNFDTICGLSFLPHTDHVYQQAPYIEITEEEYSKWLHDHPEPNVDWSMLSEYEKEDNTVSSQTLACTGGVCEIL